MSDINPSQPKPSDETQATPEAPMVHDPGHLTEPAQPETTTPEPVAAAHPQAAYAVGGYHNTTPPQTGESFQRKHHRTPLIVGTLVIGLIAGVVGGVGASAIYAANNDNSSVSSTTNNDSNTSTTGGSANIKTTKTLSASELSQVINSKLASVVTVGVVGTQESGTGSGVVLNSDGYIVTNAHVATLEGETASGTITVQTSSGDTYKAKLVGYDATADVAVLKIAANAKGISPITFADSDALTVGSTTIVIGSPLGLSGTVTTGIVSALSRPIQVASAQVSGDSSQSFGSNSSSASYVALSAIQTDAAINQGNSGGALLDQNGNLIGLSDAIATSGDSSGNIGIGFAIPGNYVKRVATEIIENGHADHGYLGASLTDYTESGASFTTGAQVNRVVSGGSAAKAGLKVGDILTKIDDTVIESATQATAIVKQDMPNTKISLTYTRGGTSHTVSITLGSTATNS